MKIYSYIQQMPQSERPEKQTIEAIKNLPVITQQKDFEDILKSYKITDPVNNPRCKINDIDNGSQYVYSIDNKNVFVVPNYYTNQAFLKMFYEHKENGEKVAYVSETRNALGLLEIKVQVGNDEAIKNLAKKQRQELIDAGTLSTALERTDTLIDFFKAQKDRADENSNWRKTFSRDSNTKLERIAWKKQGNEAKNVLNLLNNIKQSLTDLDSGNHTDGQNQDEIRQTITQHSAVLTDLERAKADFLSQSGDIVEQKIDTISYYPTATNTIPQVNELRKITKKLNGQFKILDRKEIDLDKKILLGRELENLDKYLDEVITTNDISKIKPFKPENQNAFNELLDIESKLKDFFSGSKTNTTSNSADFKDGEKKDEEKKNEGGTDNADKKIGTYSDIKDAFDKGGIKGAIEYGLDQTNMSPKQKQMRGGLANVAAIGGMVYIGWKMISSAFKLFTEDGRKKGENRSWALAPLAITGIYQGASGKNPRELRNSGAGVSGLLDMFTGKSSDKNSVEQQTYAQGFPVVSALFAGRTYSSMMNYLEDNNGQTVLKKGSREQLINELKAGDAKQKETATFLEKTDEKELNKIINLGLGGMGIDIENLKNNPDTSFGEIAAGSIVRLGSINKFMTDNGYETINPEQLDEIRNYIKNGTSVDDLQVLADRGDVFEKASNLTENEKAALQTKIDSLKIEDPKQKGQFTRAIKEFYDQRKTANKNTDSLNITRDPVKTEQIVFGTYDSTVNIDLKKKQIDKLDGITFDSNLELIRSANLINRIKNIVKINNVPNPKFNESRPGKDIEIDDASLWGLSTDTEIMSAGKNGSLRKLSKTLEDNKQAFITYLNKSFNNNIDATTSAS